MSRDMYDLSGWTPVDCQRSDEVRSGTHPVSSLTDLSGQFGEPIVYTEWADEFERPALRDYRWPESPRPCEHYVPVAVCPECGEPHDPEPCRAVAADCDCCRAIGGAS